MDLPELLAMAAEEDDEIAVKEIQKEINDYTQRIADLEFRRMFSGEVDANNAFLDVQSGSGGTEAQDWASMLLR